VAPELRPVLRTEHHLAEIASGGQVRSGMTAQNSRAATARTNTDLAGILRCVREEGRAARMIATGLEAAMAALGAEGVAIIRGAPDTAVVEPQVLHRAGMIGLPATSAAMLLWRAEVGTPAMSIEPNGRPIAVAVCRLSTADKIGTVFWRRRGARAWGSDDVQLVDSVAGIVWLLMDRDPIPRHLLPAAPTDSLTALLSQRTFITEAARHIARLDRDDLPGTLMLAEVDNLESVGQLLGPEGGDQVLRRAATLLRSAVRPTDLVGRTGDAEFAIWLSGADHLTAAERAEDLCLEAPGRIAGPENATVSEVSFSIGIASRQTGESFADLARRAGQAMKQVKREGGGYWRVSLGNNV
jgi:diguanylate cyclase (GGDEF)-like protein